MFTPLSKLAEPPPPKGVSSAQWDKVLERSPAPSTQAPTSAASTKVASIAALARASQRKLAQAAAFEEASTPPQEDVCGELLVQRLAQAQDASLLKVAQALCRTGEPEDVLDLYVQLGGRLEKTAFGTPMFQSPAAPAMPAPTTQSQQTRPTQSAPSRTAQPQQAGGQLSQSPSKPQTSSAGMRAPAAKVPAAGLGIGGTPPISR